jgi:hypothetical protein
MNRNSINDISANRRRKKNQKLLAGVIILCVVVLAFLLIRANWNPIISSFEDLFSQKSGETGFPVRLPGSSSYNIKPYDNGFMVLTETYLYTYGANGGSNYEQQHGYSAANAAVNGKRILIYDRNGKKFSYFNKNGRLYEKVTDERIAYGAVGSGEKTAIVYRSSVYSNILEIYDSKGNWKYIKRLSDENIMQVAFTSSEDEIVITTIGFSEGDIACTVRKFDILSDSDDGIWQINLPGNSIPFAIHLNRNNVFVLCDNAFFSLDANDGSIIGSYSYRGNLIDYAFSDSKIALLVNDYTIGAFNLIPLDNEAKLPESFASKNFSVSSSASQVEIYNGEIYVLESDGIAYNFIGESIRMIPLKEEYSRFIHVGGEILLLGYNTVEQLIEE